jgi:trigger factor
MTNKTPESDLNQAENPSSDGIAPLVADGGQAEGEKEAEPKLTLEVNIESRGTCQRHIAVKVSREDIDRYFEKEYTSLMSSAQLPGFRQGHVPRRILESKLRKDVVDKVKKNLLMDSIAQVSEDEPLAAISEPDFDLKAVQLPDEGAMTYEFDIEVRPEFDMPNWKGLKIERPVREFTQADVDRTLKEILSRRGQLTPHHGPAELGDYVSTSLVFTHEGKKLSSADEELIRIRPTLSFRDGKIAKFDELMCGVCAGQTRVGEAHLSDDAPNAELRGKTVTATFEVKEVKRLEVPELTPQLIQSLGFESEAEVRDVVRDNMTRQLEYQQRRRARDQVTAALTVAAAWELPPALLRRQSQRELSRAVMELQSAGFNDDQIRAHENDLRQNSMRSTARALKEHFILEKIAENEKTEETPEDYDREIELIARQAEESPRRVRARLEKTGRMDALRNQIIERKVIDLILQYAEFKDVPYPLEELDAEAIEFTAGGVESAIPEAKEE